MCIFMYEYIHNIDVKYLPLSLCILWRQVLSLNLEGIGPAGLVGQQALRDRSSCLYLPQHWNYGHMSSRLTFYIGLGILKKFLMLV